MIFTIRLKQEYRWEFNYELVIYRLKNNNYFLFQKIKEDMTGYKMQWWHCGWTERYPKTFHLNWIKKLSGNRFMSISNYGIKIYALNSKENYTIVLLDKHEDIIECVYEIDENNFIFCTSIHIGISLSGPTHDYLMIEKVCLRNISTEIISNQKYLESDD